MQNFRNKSVKVDHFAMVPRAEIPRSNFKIETAHKSTFNAGNLVPIFVDEVLPGDTISLKLTAFARMATPIFPIMDNLHMEHFFFFVPNRLVWDNWQRFMGEQDNPGDSTSFIIPVVNHTTALPPPLGLYDYFGLPTTGQAVSTTLSHSALPMRCYNLIWNQWFRDENIQNSASFVRGNGPDNPSAYFLRPRGKRKDYFTSCLPFVQKGAPVSFGLTGIVPVGSTGVAPTFNATGGSTNQTLKVQYASAEPPVLWAGTGATVKSDLKFGATTGLQVDLATATATTVNALRNSFQVQRLLERDARGGTRYTEILFAHFGVKSPDARLQRPEYLGGSHTSINIHPIAQQSGTGATGQSTPLGALAGVATGLSTSNGFSQSFTEHGYIIGLVSIRADLTYQQGIRKMWSRSTRYDFYFPVFAMLGEQPVLNQEIFFSGVPAIDAGVFGYQERWAEYRYHPSRISGLFKSTSAGTIDGWHLAQRFTTLPTLNETFIQENPPMDRVLAVGAQANGQQFIYDSFIKISATRPLPMFSVPGLIDHF
ncbi:MAG: major capsid protein [Microviridae sp.]|nr:MAG: major capsid protein [Microviridae sp.]